MKKTIKRENWEINIENVLVIPSENVKFLFYQSEKFLEETIKVFDEITAKTTNMITLISALLISEAAYFFDKLDVRGELNDKLVTLFILIIYTFIILWNLLNIIKPFDYSPLGSKPSKLSLAQSFKNDSLLDVDTNIRTLYLYLDEIESYEMRIRNNEDVNNIRVEKFKHCLYATALLPPIGIILYFIISFILFH